MSLNVLQREKEVWKNNPNMQPELDDFNILDDNLNLKLKKILLNHLKKSR